MKKVLIRILSNQSWVYRLALKLIANRIVWGNNHLTPKYLTDRGWVKEGDFYVEPNMKDRDGIWLQFENHYFRVWHGKEKTFIALESKVEWFENYYLLAHGDNGRYELAGV
jgi:hypothetical protein